MIDGATHSEVLVAALQNLASNTQPGFYTNTFSPQDLPTAVYNSNVLILPVGITGNSNGFDFGSSGNTRFNYRVVTFDRSSDGMVDQLHQPRP